MRIPAVRPPRDQPTRWSLVRRAVSGGEGALTALEEILAFYWYPLYAWARRRGWSEEDAADGVQSFLEKVCSTNLLASAREERGRLRSWLLKCFGHHLNDLRRYQGAQKRGGGQMHFSIDWEGVESVYLAEPALSETPEALYARTWAVSLMEEALQRLARHYAATNRTALHDAILPALEAPLEGMTYEDLAPSLGVTAVNLRTAVVRMRQRYRTILLELAAERLGITCEAALKRELCSILGGQA